MKEPFKKKMVMNKLTWAGYVGIMGDEKLAESRYPESKAEKVACKTKIALGDCIKSDTETVGEEWRKSATYTRHLRLLIERT